LRPVLAAQFHRPLRWCTAALCFAGTGLAVAAMVPAYTRLGAAQGVVFTVVAVVSIGFAVAVLRVARWALLAAVVLLGGQFAAVVGTIWELRIGIDAGKATQLRAMGFDPTAGVVINLVYSAAGSALFCWWAWRWYRAHRSSRTAFRPGS
jgi:hypothetical protein